MRRLTTSSLLASRQCHKRLWLSTFETSDTDSNDRYAREGIRLGEVAREIYGAGQLITAEHGIEQAIVDTAVALLGSEPVYEATFADANVVTRLDILRPNQGRWDLIEVKSGTSVKPEYLEYMAIQAFVCQKAGMPLGEFILSHVNSDFVYVGDGDYAGLLTESNVSVEVMALLPSVDNWIQEASVTLQSSMPHVAPGRFCKSPQPCDFYTKCQLESGITFPVEILPNGWRRTDALRAAGYRDLCKVPEHELTADAHRTVREVSKSGVEYRAPGLAAQFGAMPYHRYYLDFETIAYAVPRWKGTRPHQAIPFQWSLHVEDHQGNLSHREFLTTTVEDPRETFLDALLDALGVDGPIIVYSPFEESRLKDLAQEFPKRASAIQAVITRLVDLLPIVRTGFYAAVMKGSFSIKKVLPALAPEVSYDVLEDVSNGTEAMEAFDRMIELAPTTTEYDQLRNNMLKYCRLDTYAMVAVVRRLVDPSCRLPLDES